MAEIHDYNTFEVHTLAGKRQCAGVRCGSMESTLYIPKGHSAMLCFSCYMHSTQHTPTPLSSTAPTRRLQSAPALPKCTTCGEETRDLYTAITHPVLKSQRVCSVCLGPALHAADIDADRAKAVVEAKAKEQTIAELAATVDVKPVDVQPAKPTARKPKGGKPKPEPSPASERTPEPAPAELIHADSEPPRTAPPDELPTAEDPPIADVPIDAPQVTVSQPMSFWAKLANEKIW